MGRNVPQCGPEIANSLRGRTKSPHSRYDVYKAKDNAGNSADQYTCPQHNTDYQSIYEIMNGYSANSATSMNGCASYSQMRLPQLTGKYGAEVNVEY